MSFGFHVVLHGQPQQAVAGLYTSLPGRVTDLRGWRMRGWDSCHVPPRRYGIVPVIRWRMLNLWSFHRPTARLRGKMDMSTLLPAVPA
ncbi:hypothetical protein Tharo_0258 [Thauera aromatica K172]|uniref:Uncharacterized protein n=1 Tax=Thauera aromatica K172 TaxID=44139 RepID=A0A2R4BIS2_THAAR|nr:hypothetical protein Tharo_0258 [Thauera aromatica K172]